MRTRNNILSFASGILVAVVFMTFQCFVSRMIGFTGTIPIPMEPFPEAPWRTSSTLGARTVTSTPFARFEIHRVLTENGIVVDDWLWTDERSHVNILVSSLLL